MIKLITTFLIFTVVGCKASELNNLPNDLNEAISYFENKWTIKEKEFFIKDSLKNAHFSTGRWIRNNWIYGERDTNLVHYFNKLGIYHPDDMSSIILTSLFRKLTNKPIDLKEQIEMYQAYWKPILECNQQQKKKAVENYNRFKIGDKISIFMAVDTTYGQRNAVIYDCPNVDWDYNPEVDLHITGIIKEKYCINDSSNVFFKLQLTKLNHPDTKLLMEDVNEGYILDISLNGLRIE